MTSPEKARASEEARSLRSKPQGVLGEKYSRECEKLSKKTCGFVHGGSTLDIRWRHGQHLSWRLWGALALHCLFFVRALVAWA